MGQLGTLGPQRNIYVHPQPMATERIAQRKSAVCTEKHHSLKYKREEKGPQCDVLARICAERVSNARKYNVDEIWFDEFNTYDMLAFDGIGHPNRNCNHKVCFGRRKRVI